MPPETAKLKGRKRSLAVRRRMALAQKERWAKMSEPPAPTKLKPAKPKRRISPEGMARIIAATKKRWRLARAGTWDVCAEMLYFNRPRTAKSRSSHESK